MERIFLLNQKKKKKTCTTLLRVFQGYHSQFRGKLFDRTILQPFYTTYMHIVEASRAVNIDFLSRGKGRKFTSTMLQIPRRGVNDYCLSRSRSSFDFRAKENRGLSPNVCHVSNRWKLPWMQREEWRRIAFMITKRTGHFNERETLIVPFVFPPTSPTCSNFSSSSFA